MEFLLELLKITLPAALVLYAMYLTVKSFIQQELEKTQTELRLKQTELLLKSNDTLLATRLQAYERMALFLERISPSQLIPRINQPGLTAGALQYLLNQEIRAEFAHNLSQQVYMSSEVWLLIKKGMEEIIFLINNSMNGVDEEADSLVLAKRIFENTSQLGVYPTQEALEALKEELRQYYIPAATRTSANGVHQPGETPSPQEAVAKA